MYKIPNQLFNHIKDETYETLKGVAWFLLFRWTRTSAVFEQLKLFASTKSDNTSDSVSSSSTKILFFATRQDPTHVSWYYLLFNALKVRGNKVSFVGCDRALQKTCNERCYPKNRNYVCDKCYMFASKFYKAGDLELNWLSKYIEPYDVSNAEQIVSKLAYEDYKQFCYYDMEIGELVRPSVCHFLRVEDIEYHTVKEPDFSNIYRDYIVGALVMVAACKRILKQEQPEKIIMINGLFMAERILYELAREESIDTIVIESGLRPDSLVLLHNQYICYSKIEGWDLVKDKTLSKDQIEMMENYMTDREIGGGQTLNYWKDIQNKKTEIINQYSLDQYDHIAVLFPNVTWDSALYGLHTIFESLHQWIDETIKFFENNKKTCLIIRSHPGDAVFEGGMRDSIYTYLTENYKDRLPSNIVLIEPSNSISSYTLMDISDVGLVFASTTGLEMAFRKKLVIVVGKAHYCGRGFTLDVNTKDDYFGAIDDVFNKTININKVIDYDATAKYVYYVFFQISHTLKGTHTNAYRADPQLTIISYDQLKPGNDEVQDMICDRVVDGRPFLMI